MSNVITLSDLALNLSLVPLFNQLEDVELEKLAEEVEQFSFKSNEAIFHAHDQGDALYKSL